MAKKIDITPGGETSAHKKGAEAPKINVSDASRDEGIILDRSEKIKPPEADASAAIEFLKLYCPTKNGKVHVTSILGEEPPVTTTFDRESLSFTLPGWVVGLGETKNAYFSLNEVKMPKSGKASKKDVVRFKSLWVDVDPEVGEAKECLYERIRKHSITPSFVIDSGGGYWAVWLLEPCDELEVNGDLQKIAELERYSQQLAHELGGDSCWNAERIARLPGTVNWPNSKKIEKGRTPALAKLLDWTGLRYPLSLFSKAPRGKAPGSVGGELYDEAYLASGVTVTIDPANVRDLGVDGLRELAQTNRWNISDTTYSIIACGTDPIEAEK